MRRKSCTTGPARLRIVGVGGGGCNAIGHMITKGIYGVEFVAINTDARALARSNSPTRLCIGKQATGYLGAGGDPALGRQAAIESFRKIKAAIAGSDMVFITAGMGGGTGTGAAPIVAQVARKLGAFTVAIVTRPFSFEGGKQAEIAEEGLNKLKDLVDTLIVIPNDRLLSLVSKQTSLPEAFQLVNDVLYRSFQGLCEMITVPGLINLDFADVKTVMSKPGGAMIGVGFARGIENARIAGEQAACSPLLDMSIAGARDILVNITSGPRLSLEEIKQVTEVIQEIIHPDANVILGTALDRRLGDELRVTVVATGVKQPAPFKSLLQFNNIRKSIPDIILMSPAGPPPEPANDEVSIFSLQNFMMPAYLRNA